MRRIRQLMPAFAFVVLVGGACTGPPGSPELTGTETTYTTFYGATVPRTAYLGRNVALLVPSGDTATPSTLTSIIRTLDAAWDHYERITQAYPGEASTYEGRSTIAVVDETCGAGCGYVGATGIELTPESWERLSAGVRDHGQYDQAVFYELGRNFWLLSPELAPEEDAYGSSVTTGFAVLNRFTSMAAAGVDGAPFNDLTFAEFEAEVRGLVDLYEANPALDWWNTLAVEAGVPGTDWGATDLVASFMMRLGDYFGPEFLDRVWIEAAQRPVAANTAAAVDNLVLAASAAAEQNLTSLFAETWRFPVSSSAATYSQSTWGNPWLPH